jgi:Ca-activated chloride channel family protein
MIDFDLRFWTYNYAFPEVFWLFVFIWVLLGFWIFYKRKAGFKWNAPRDRKSFGLSALFLASISKILMLIAVSSIIIGIAGPHRLNEENLKKMEYTEGIDIILSVDISLSMLARDFEPDRLEAAKRVAAEFVKSRPNDRIGLVLYEGEAYTACPATTDHTMLLQKIGEIKAGVLDTRQTAIGMGLGLAVARLRDDNLVSKVVILMSDGVSNAGEIDPYTAAELAQNKNVKVYTIGIGSRGTAPFPVQTVFGTRYQQMEVEIDEEALTFIAESTGGKYFRATDESALSEIYATIDEMEKTEVFSEFSRFEIPTQSAQFYLLGLAFLFLAVLTSKVLLKGIAHE